MDFPYSITTKSAEETQKLGKTLGTYLKGQKPEYTQQLPLVLVLSGALGSGKTTFTQGLAQAFGITNRLLSPTYIIVRQYQTDSSKRFYHIDLYRASSFRFQKSLGLSEVFSDPDAIVVVEWGDLYKGNFPIPRVEITFTPEKEAHRILMHWQSTK